MPKFNVENYVDVQERINRFWAEHPTGRIVTELMTHPTDWQEVVFKATVYREYNETLPAVTGWAAESAGTSDRDGANLTSWHENCETSAIGRALANMGYAKDRNERPSRQEMEKVNRGPVMPVAPRESTPPVPAMDMVVRRGNAPAPPVSRSRPPKNVTANQWVFALDLIDRLRFPEDWVAEQVAIAYDLPPDFRLDEIDRAHLSVLIDWLKAAEKGSQQSFLDHVVARRGPQPAAPAPSTTQEPIDQYLAAIANATSSSELDTIWNELDQTGMVDSPLYADALRNAFDRAIVRQEKMGR